VQSNRKRKTDQAVSLGLQIVANNTAAKL